jgi:copper(I)-binding protein
VRHALPGCLALLLAMAADAGTLAVDSAWLREPAPGQGVVAIYLHIANTGAAARVLSGAHVAGASGAAVHEHTMVDGMMRMRAAGPVTIPPGGDLRLEPGGYHLMVFGLAPAPVAGQHLPFCLQTQDGAELCATAEVRGLAP